MTLKTFLALLLVIPLFAFSQTQKGIPGKIPNVDNDTLITYPDFSIPDKYYEIERAISVIEDENFSMSYTVTYPQLFYTVFSSDQGYVLNRPKAFFIDPTSKAVHIDTVEWENSYVDGEVGQAYEQRFKPFVSMNMPNNNSHSFYSLPFLRDVSVDTVLYSYTQANPDSYIPLWFLIKRYYQFGHSQVKADHLDVFSDEVKSSKIWKLIKNDIDRSLLKQGEPFPFISVVDSQLEVYPLNSSQAKFFVLDFWFTSCKPCLEALPQLNAIYSKYNERGIEIISISVDRGPAIEKWRSRIAQKDMPWKHCLDVSGVESRKLFVKNFPRYMLLDTNWTVIRADISLDELETFLLDNL